MDKAVNDLQDAIEVFQNSKLDWRALKAAVADAANVAADKANYVDDTDAWEAFDDAYAAAQNMLESKTAADQAAIDEVATALLEASSNLRYKADKDTLKAVIGDAENVDVTLYTASSVAMFRSALAAANTVLADESLSVDDQVVHGIPSENQVLREGSIISIDCGLVLDGWQADSAFTMGIGEISAEAEALIEVTEECFWKGVRQAVAGNRLGDVGHAIQSWAESHGYGVIRDLTGHGIGREMHEDPAVYNFGEPGHGLRLRKGMTLAVEPMIAAGDWHVNEDDDEWCFRTRDGSLCSHYEHTIAIREDGLPEILTSLVSSRKEEE